MQNIAPPNAQPKSIPAPYSGVYELNINENGVSPNNGKQVKKKPNAPTIEMITAAAKIFFLAIFLANAGYKACEEIFWYALANFHHLKKWWFRFDSFFFMHRSLEQSNRNPYLCKTSELSHIVREMLLVIWPAQCLKKMFLRKYYYFFLQNYDNFNKKMIKK